MYLQAAIDAGSLDQAELLLGRYQSIPEISYIEIGSPLISQFGVAIVSLFKRHFTIDRLYADLKIVDFPVLEALPYQVAGIEKLSVMACMNDQAFEELAEFSRKTRTQIFISTMGYPVSLLRRRAQDLMQCGFKNFICHGSGVSSQQAFDDLLARVGALRDLDGIALVGAGGITLENVHRLRPFKLTGIIVGRGLHSAENPADVARGILRNGAR